MCGISRGHNVEEEARKLREEDERKRRQEAQARGKATDKPANEKEKSRELTHS